MVKLVNRAKMSTATTGTGTITLGSAESGYQSFADAGVADGETVRYVIEDGTAWEIGTGIYSASGTTLSRTVDESTNSDAALNLSGSAVVYVSAAAEDIQEPLELYAENRTGFYFVAATGDNAVAIGNSAIASGLNGMSFGNSASSTGTNSVAVGTQASGSALYTTAVGGDAVASQTYATALGVSSRAAGSSSVSLSSSYSSGATSLAAAIGNSSSSYGATGTNSVAIGYQAKATGADSIAIGDTNTSSAQGAATFGGAGNTASASYSLATGYQSLSGIVGKTAHASGQFSAQGDAQTGTFVLRSDTTDATSEALTTNNSTAGTTNQIIVPNNSAYAFHGTIVAREQASAGTDCAAWKIEGLIRREGSAGTTVLVNSATTVLDNTPAWGLALSADTTNGGLKIEVTGAAATNIRWVATINTSECSY